jgi:pimeloyl-ACP methyl ester carboxylesterase
MLAQALAAVLAAAPTVQARLPLRPCIVQGVPARCGTLVVPEDRTKPAGRTIALRVVVVPSRVKPTRPDEFTYLAGGPGGAATQFAGPLVGLWPGIHEHHDMVFVDQRGTGGSRELTCPQPAAQIDTPDQLKAFLDDCFAALGIDPTQYGTVAAMDDLDAVRAALGYRTLDVYGTSYGATAAQVFLNRHPRSVRTVVLDGGTLLDIPFLARFSSNGERALDLLAARCSADARCARTYPGWRTQLSDLIARWNESPVELNGERLGGDWLAGVVQSLTLSAGTAVRIPLLVSRAAAGDTSPLEPYASGVGTNRQIMFWSIWCNEPWVGIAPAAAAADAAGTYLEGYSAGAMALYSGVCSVFPKRAEPAPPWARPRSRVPLLAVVGGADPQDPVGNLAGLRQALPNSRIVIEPGQGHAVGQYGCVPSLVTRFVERGTARGLDTRCVRALPPPGFAY